MQDSNAVYLLSLLLLVFGDIYLLGVLTTLPQLIYLNTAHDTHFTYSFTRYLTKLLAIDRLCNYVLHGTIDKVHFELWTWTCNV